MKYSPDQKGFSLIELLVVVVIIGIIAAIAIPSMLQSRRTANEATALANLRNLHTAQQTFSTTNSGSFGTFAQLSAATLLDASWTAATVKKNGFTFALAPATPTLTFCATAIPDSGAGTRAFAVSQQGVLYQNGGTTAPVCDSSTGIISTGTVVGS